MRIALTGNPNSGKTTMFNALTGRNEKVGNWAGVTVERKEHSIKKSFNTSTETLIAVDLPGAYSMSPFTSEESIVPDFEVGKSYDMIYGPISLGIDPMTGLPVFKGGDGREISAIERLTRDDIVALGHSTPPYSGSFFYSLSYGNFDLDVDFYFVFGGKKAYSFSYVRGFDNARYNAIVGQVNNMWFQEGDEGKIYHRPYYSSSAVDNLKLYANSRTIGKSDYLRLSSLSLRYRLPYKWIEKTKNVIQYASVAFQASNLFTWTHYKESDPESGSLVGTQQPVFTLKLSVSF